MITSGLWNSVFAKSPSALSDEFIPIVLHTEKRADYSQDEQNNKLQSISLLIVKDILQDEEIISAVQLDQRIGEFYNVLQFPVPSANSLPISRPETVSQISTIIEAQRQAKEILASPGNESFVEETEDTSSPVTTTPEPNIVETSDTGVEDDGEDRGVEDDGENPGAEDEGEGPGGGKGNNDDKDGNPNDGDAGKGNDDKDKGKNK